VAFIDWVENSALSIWMVDSIWAYPIMLSMHAVGMSIVVGTVFMIDFRILGFAKEAPLTSFGGMLKVTWLGVTLNFLSGVALFASNSEQFLFNPLFWTKIGLMVLGVLSVFALWRKITHQHVDGATMVEATGSVKHLARFSLLLWLGVIIAGRLVAYIDFG
jgi:hypothetical protein